VSQHSCLWYKTVVRYNCVTLDTIQTYPAKSLFTTHTVQSRPHRSPNANTICLITGKGELISLYAKEHTTDSRQYYNPHLIDPSHLTSHSMDKENANVIIRKNTSSTAGRTPPRMRCINISNTPSSQSVSSMKSLNNAGVHKNIHAKEVEDDEDFSFQKLRGAVKSFEKKQQHHYSKNANVFQPHTQTPFNTVNSRGSTSTGTTTSTDSGKSHKEEHPSSITLTPRRKSKSKPKLVKAKPLTPKRTPTRPKTEIENSNMTAHANPCTPKLTPTKEDFSFQALKQRALKMEGKVARPNHDNDNENANDPENFSFQKLKQKALHIEQHGASTPMRNKSNRTFATPIRTPAKRNIPMTPQTAGSTSKSRCRDGVSPFVLPQPSARTHSNAHASAPSTNVPIQMNSSTRLAPPATMIHNKEQPQSNAPSQSQVQNPGRTAASTTFHPHRYKFGPKIKKEEVQATDESIASVQKLSQWLSNDPFDERKKAIVRKGVQIAKKSRAFEADDFLRDSSGRKLSRVEREKEHFRDGTVSQGKSWLKNAFGEGKEEEEDLSGVLEKQRMIQNAFKKKPHVAGLRH
jgi:hypothetical protein